MGTGISTSMGTDIDMKRGNGKQHGHRRGMGVGTVTSMAWSVGMGTSMDTSMRSGNGHWHGQGVQEWAPAWHGHGKEPVCLGQRHQHGQEVWEQAQT